MVPTDVVVLPTGCHFGLIAHDAHSASVHAGEAHHDVLGVVGHDLEEVPLVHDLRRGVTRGNFNHMSV